MLTKFDASLKRAFDIALAVMAILVFSPLLVATAIIVKLSSPGPVFYRGVRTGRYGKPFRIWKFRSMVVAAESTGGTTTGKNDLRITRVGRVLRKYKLDELPQLLNVVAGEMSFVGPRPEVYEYTNQYSRNERRILQVRPGITDFASIEFNDLQESVGPNDADRVYRERVLPTKNRLRLKYADERNLWLDLCILARTIMIVSWKPIAAVTVQRRSQSQD